MLPSVILALLALISTPFDPKIAFLLFLVTTLLYSSRRKLRLAIRNVREEESYFNAFLLSTFLSALACFALSKDVVYASIFLVAAHEVRRGAIWNIAVYTSTALMYFLFYNFIVGGFIELANVFFLALAGGLTASLVESVDSDADKRVTIILAAATVFSIFKVYIPSASLPSLASAFLISFVMSLVALKAGVADESGLMSATIIGTTLILFTDFRFFVVLLTFYILGSIVTKYKYDLKLSLGIAEQAGGARGYANVFGNSLAPLFFAMHYGVSKHEFFAAAFIASLATALGDTMASEIGKASSKVYLITNFKRVKPGVSGGVSIPGEVAAITGAFIVSAIGSTLGIIEWSNVAATTIAAFAAIHVDSVLGATLEKKGYLTNSTVNLFATLSAGVFCYFLL